MGSFSSNIHSLTQYSKLLAISLKLELKKNKNMFFFSILELKFDHAASKIFENTGNV